MRTCLQRIPHRDVVRWGALIVMGVIALAIRLDQRDDVRQAQTAASADAAITARRYEIARLEDSLVRRGFRVADEAATPQDLSGSNALAFWSKASRPALLNQLGFGLVARGVRVLLRLVGVAGRGATLLAALGVRTGVRGVDLGVGLVLGSEILEHAGHQRRAAPAARAAEAR